MLKKIAFAFLTALVLVNVYSHTTTFVNQTELDFTLSEAELATAGALSITVLNSDGAASPAVSFIINASGPPPARRRAAPHT